MAPDKIYIAETPNKLIEIWSEEPIESKPYITEHEYIRKDALLEWAQNMKRVCKGAEPIEKAYQTIIDKIESL